MKPGRPRKRRQYDTTPTVELVEFANYDPVNLETFQTYQTPTVTLTSVPWPSPEDGALTPQPLTGLTVTYETSNAAVATISGSGLVTAVGAGSCAVNALCEGVRSPTITVTVTNPQNAVDHLVVTPATMGLTISGTGQVAGRPEDTSNNLVTGATVTWGSNNTGVATVGADSGDDNHTATVTAVTAGEATITGTSETKTDTCVVTVSSGTLYFADKFDSADKSRNVNNWRWKQGGDATVQLIPSGLSSTTYGLRHRHTATNSNQEQRMYFGSGVTDLYVGFYIHHPSNFEHRDGPSSDNHKLLRVWNGNTADGNDGYAQYHLKGGFSTLPYTSAPTWPAGSARIISEMGMGPGCGDNSVGEEGGGTLMPAFAAATAQWRALIFHLRGATSPSANNGILETWIDGTLAQSRTNLPWYSSCSDTFTKAYFEGAANQGWNTTQDIFITRVRLASTAALADPTNTTGW